MDVSMAPGAEKDVDGRLLPLTRLKYNQQNRFKPRGEALRTSSFFGR